MSVLCAILRTCDFQGVPTGLRGAEISTKNFSQGVFITWLYQLVAAKIVLKELLAGDGVGGVYSPISMAQIPVPAPMSRIFTGTSFGSGQKCNLLSMTILTIWWNRSRRSNSVFGQISIFSQSQCSWSGGVYIIIGHNVGCRSVAVSKH